MTITIDLPPAVERVVVAEATRLRTDVATAVRTLLEQTVATAKDADAPPHASTAALFDQWAAEDATDDPAELERRQREWEEFRDAMNASSTRGRPIYP